MIMAAVMAGGMVPPLVIALSTTFFKNRWTEADRKAGLVNYIMGLSFITEGAIPLPRPIRFACCPPASWDRDRRRSVDALWLLRAPLPHGGAWAIAVITNPVQYLLALAIGAVVGCLVLSFLKKPLDKATE